MLSTENVFYLPGRGCEENGKTAAAKAADTGAGERDIASAAINAAIAKASDMAFVARAAEAELGPGIVPSNNVPCPHF